MRRALFLTGLLAIAGCITPSIPIPPPDPAQMQFHLTGDDTSGHQASFAYPANVNLQGAVVYVYNRRLQVGIIEAAHTDGSVGPTAPVRAEVGDEMVVSFERDDQTESTCVKLREGSQSSTDYCGP